MENLNVQKEGDKTEILNDSNITRKIRAEIMKDPFLKGISINISTHDGIVELSGNFESEQVLERSQEIAHNINGVKAIEIDLVTRENIEILDLAGTIADNSDSRMSASSIINRKIKSKVMTEPSLRDFQLHVRTIQGRVTISGGVDCIHSVEKILQIASNVEGVKTVENHLYARRGK